MFRSDFRIFIICLKRKGFKKKKSQKQILSNRVNDFYHGFINRRVLTTNSKRQLYIHFLFAMLRTPTKARSVFSH